MPGKRQHYLDHPPGFRRLSEAVRAHEARGGKAISRTRWGQLLALDRVRGAVWDGWYWWVPPGRIVILPGKTKNGAPKRIHLPSS